VKYPKRKWAKQYEKKDHCGDIPIVLLKYVNIFPTYRISERGNEVFTARSQVSGGHHHCALVEKRPLIPVYKVHLFWL
jgi:hypothetical protein